MGALVEEGIFIFIYLSKGEMLLLPLGLLSQRGGRMREEGGGRRKWRKEKVKSLWMEGKCKVGGIVRELEALKIMQIRLPPQHAVDGTKRGLPDPAEIER